MIVIKKVEAIETPYDYYEFIDREKYKNEPSCLNSSAGLKPLSFVTEIIKGRRYVYPKLGIDITIGCSKEVNEAIGVLLLSACHDNIQGELNIARGELSIAKGKLRSIGRYGFWKRLVCLFTGIQEAGE